MSTTKGDTNRGERENTGCIDLGMCKNALQMPILKDVPCLFVIILKDVVGRKEHGSRQSEQIWNSWS